MFKGIVMFIFKGIVRVFPSKKVKNFFFFVIAIYQAHNFALASPLHEKSE